MASTPFYTGGFTTSPQYVTWNGTDENDVIDYINNIVPAPDWSVVSVVGSVLTISNGTTTRVANIDDWISASSFGPVNVVAPSSGRWITPDPSGRPVSASDIEA